MTNPSTDSYRNALRHMGQDYSFAPRYVRQRDPLTPTNASGDIKPKENQGYYPLGSFWSNSSNGSLWVLASIVNNLSNWILLSGGSAGPLVKVGVPFGTSPVLPDANGLINFTSTDGSVVITGSAGGLGAQDINFSSAEGAFTYVSISIADSPYTALSTDDYISCDTSGGAITIRLPNAPTANKRYYIKDRTGNATVNNISVTTVGGAVTIDGLTTYLIAGNHGSISVLFNSTSYEVY